MDLYNEVKAMGFETDHHESDLYVLASPEFLAWRETLLICINLYQFVNHERKNHA